jgi:hypothetical protein
MPLLLLYTQEWLLRCLTYCTIDVCIAASPLSLAITLNVACLLSLAIILDVDLFCIWKSRINQLVLGSLRLFLSFLFQIPKRPFCFGRNLQYHIGLWDESCKASRLFLAIVLDVNLFCIWKSRINQLVLGPQLMFAFPLYGSFLSFLVQILQRPFCMSESPL